MFTHAQYRRVCDELDKCGQVVNSMCTEEREKTLALITLFTSVDQEQLESVVRNILPDIKDLSAHTQEEAHAEKCN